MLLNPCRISSRWELKLSQDLSLIDTGYSRISSRWELKLKIFEDAKDQIV